MAYSRFGLAIALLASALACNGESASPTAPTAARVEPTRIQSLVAHAAADPSGAAMDRALSLVFDGSSSGSMAITFPPRNEPLEFRNALEAKYRDGLRRGAVQTFVDAEGTIVWTQEYLRYRVNFCSHADAVSRVMSQIDGQGIAAACGNATTATFPPRNEPFAFMQQLEAKYRDGLRRTAGSSFVDVEGNIVWTQEYLRYRVSGCAHASDRRRIQDVLFPNGLVWDGERIGTVVTAPAFNWLQAISQSENGVASPTGNSDVYSRLKGRFTRAA